MDPKTKDGPEQKHKIYKIKPEKLEDRSTMLGTGNKRTEKRYFLLFYFLNSTKTVKRLRTEWEGMLHMTTRCYNIRYML